mgnify:CR=1 FL=1
MSSAASPHIPNRQSPSQPYRPLRTLVEEGLGPARALASEREIAIDLVGSSSLPVAIPIAPFAEIIRRLVGSAVMESRRGSRVEIAWHRSRDEVVLTVRDEGLPARRGAGGTREGGVPAREGGGVVSAPGGHGPALTPPADPAQCAGPLQELGGSMDVITRRPGGGEVRLVIPVTYTDMAIPR